jgi:hypothetical protein
MDRERGDDGADGFHSLLSVIVLRNVVISFFPEKYWDGIGFDRTLIPDF